MSGQSMTQCCEDNRLERLSRRGFVGFPGLPWRIIQWTLRREIWSMYRHCNGRMYCMYFSSGVILGNLGSERAKGVHGC